jgi:hypothetical protein
MSDTKIDHSKKQPKYIAYHIRQGKEGEKGSGPGSESPGLTRTAASAASTPGAPR